MTSRLRLTRAALDESEGSIVLRGRIDPQTLDALLVDDYQRELCPVSTINEIINGFKNGGRVPDIELGMRGARTRDKDGDWILLDDVYIIDGQQRVHAGKRFLQQGGLPLLGATVYFDTNHDWEKKRFAILNSQRSKVSSNIMVRNLRDEYPVIQSLYVMTTEENGLLKDRVCWQQRKQRLHLITALTLIKMAGNLHSHMGRGRSSRHTDLVPQLQKIFTKTGNLRFKDNVRAFFDVIDTCWGFRTIVYTEGAAQINNSFLKALALVLSNSACFWKDDLRLMVDNETLRKLRSFSVMDPTVRQLAGASGKASILLYNMLVEHVNRGRRKNRLKERVAISERMGQAGANLHGQESEESESEAVVD